jgi:hypothetical protein
MISFLLFCENDYHHAFVMAPSASLGLDNTLNVPSNRYGFWVNKWGHWKGVSTYGHQSAANELIAKYHDQTGINIYSGGAYSTLYRHGYVRVVVDDGIKIRWEHPSKSFTLTQSQQKVLNQLEQVYKLPVERDKYTNQH